jgi:hypothetical protein
VSVLLGNRGEEVAHRHVCLARSRRDLSGEDVGRELEDRLRLEEAG